MLSESSLTLRGFRRGTPPMRPAHLKDGQSDLYVQIARRIKQEAFRARCRKLAICRTRRPERGKSCSNNLERSQLFQKLAIDIEAQPAQV